MKVFIDPDLEKLVQETVANGRYDSPQELVREALLAFLKTDAKFGARIERLQQEIALGLRDIEQGKVAAFDANAIKRLGRRRLSSRQV